MDNGIILDTVDRGAAKDVLAGTFEAGKESPYNKDWALVVKVKERMKSCMERQERTDEIGGHEGLRKLLVVLVVALPQRILLRIEIFPEPGQGDFPCLFVRVLALPIVES